MNKGYNRLNAFKLESVELYSHDRSKSILLDNAWVSIILQEDMFSNTTIGALTFTDSADLYNTFPIVGEEFVIVSFSVPGNNIKQSIIMAVNSYTHPIPDPSGKRKVILLELVSAEMIINAGMTIFKGTGNRPAEKIISEIITEDIKSQKKYKNNSKSGNVSAVIAGLHPFEAIKFIAKRTISKSADDASPWLFFETFNDGYVFMSLRDILNTGIENFEDDKHTLKLDRITDENKDVRNPFLAIQRISYEANNNKILQLTDGELSSDVYQLDLLNKKVTKFKHKYKNIAVDFSDKKLNKFKEFSSEFISNHTKEPAANFLLTSNFSFDKSEYIDDNIGINIGSKIGFINSLELQNVTIEVAGNPSWSVGQVIYLDIPESTGVEKNTFGLDRRVAGYYCIEAVKLVIDRLDMISTLKLFSLGSNINIDKTVGSNDK